MSDEANDKSKERHCDAETRDFFMMGIQIVMVASYVLFCALVFIVVAP